MITVKRKNSGILPIIIISCALALVTGAICFNSLQKYGDAPERGSSGSYQYLTGHSGLAFSYQSYITPGDRTIRDIASRISRVEEAYDMANDWVYVSEETMYGIADKWLPPSDFLNDSPAHPGNPVPGQAAGDCEEQANTLVSILRAMGIPPEEVRVVLGYVARGDINRGHVWVETYINGKWLSLDPSQGPYWDDDAGILVRRQGAAFDYYISHAYPVPEVAVYYNDKYYMETGDDSEEIPELWKNKPGENRMAVKK